MSGCHFSGLRTTANEWLFPPPVLCELTDVAAGQNREQGGQFQ